MSEEDARALAAERLERRRAGDFAAADALRLRIRGLGYDVVDRSDGFDLRPVEEAAPPRRLDPRDVPTALARPADRDVTVHWLAEGWPDDVLRGIASFDRHAGARSVQHVVAEVADTGAVAWPQGAEILPLREDAGWARARNAGLERTCGSTVIVADSSIEVTGDVLGPIEDALADPAVGLVGPFGLVTADLRTFEPAPGPGCDAVEGYLMAFRRELLERGLRFDPGFRWYRAADVDLSFRVLDMGLALRVVDVPVRRHAHRAWEAVDEARRASLSKRNLYRFLGRWRGRTDLTLAARRGRSG